MIPLAIEADDEHRTPVAIASRLIRSENGRVPALGCGIADTLAEAAMAKFVGAAKEFNGIVGIIRSKYGFHGPVMLVAKGKDVRPHARASVTPSIIETLNHLKIELSFLKSERVPRKTQMIQSLHKFSRYSAARRQCRGSMRDRLRRADLAPPGVTCAK
jgi:hypothetical protein